MVNYLAAGFNSIETTLRVKLDGHDLSTNQWSLFYDHKNEVPLSVQNVKGSAVGRLASQVGRPGLNGVLLRSEKIISTIFIRFVWK